MVRTTAPAMPAETMERTLYTGLLKMYVASINPSLAELIQLGINTDKEPVYEGKSSREDAAGNKVEHDNYRLDFWLKSDEHDILVKHSVWISREDAAISKEGKIQVANDKFQFTWVTPDHFKAGTVPNDKNGNPWFATPYRRAKEGEAPLRDFVNAWTNQTKEKVAVTYKFGDLIQGKLKTLYDIAGTERDFNVLVMLGVRTNDEGRQYQAISRNVFNHWTSPKKVWDSISKEQGSVNYEVSITEFIPSDFRIREFKGYGSHPSFTSQQVIRKDLMQGLPNGTPPPAGQPDEDLPF